MIRLFLLCFYTSLLIASSSCGGGTSVPCRNEMSLLSADPSVPIIELDFSKSSNELEFQIRQKTSGQSLKLPPQFRLKIEGRLYHSSVHAAHISQFACYGMPAMQHKSPQLEVKLNRENQLIVEGRELLAINEIEEYIEWYFPHDRPFGEKIVHLECINHPEPDSIKEVIKNIGVGYLKYYEKEALQRYKEPLCDLDSVELKEIKKQYPFNLRLWLGDPSESTPLLGDEIAKDISL